MEINNQIFFFFYNLAHQSNFFDKLVVFIAVYFPYFVLLSAAIFLIFYRKNLREFFMVFFSAGLAYILAKALKILIHLPRPGEALSAVYPLFPADGYAFPSGHAAVFATLAFALFFVHKKAGYLFMLFALLIGLARIISGVHFPADILGGFALGFLTGFLIAYLAKNARMPYIPRC